MSQAEVTQGTDEGDIIASIAIGASSVVTMLIIVVGVLLLGPLQPILTSAPVKVATVLSAWVLYRMGQITLIPKNTEKK